MHLPNATQAGIPAVPGVDSLSRRLLREPESHAPGHSLDLKLAIIRDPVAERQVATIARKRSGPGDSWRLAVQLPEGHHQLTSKTKLRSPALLQRFGSRL